MKTSRTALAILILSLSSGAHSLFAGETGANPAVSGPGFFVGQSSFPKGDFIELTSVWRTNDAMTVKGHYRLVSADTASLAFYITSTSTNTTPDDPQEETKVSKGEGDFELTHPHIFPGLPHVTMYSLPESRPFAGVYFGDQEQAAEEGKMDIGYYNSEPAASSSSLSLPNQALLAYLGNPVPPPADMDGRYTTTGLKYAILLAAQNAGITVKEVQIDDSEFPFLVGVICAGSDFSQLKVQLKKLDGYEYNGSIGNDRNSDGSDTCNVFSLVPYRAYPPGATQPIYHRLWLRQQVFYDKVNGHANSADYASTPAGEQPKLPTMKIYLGKETLDAELARTIKEQATGMMFRTNLQETDAMLFVLPFPQHASFWMKNCPESISAAYVGPNGVIEEIHHLEKNDTTPVVAANGDIQFVLETKDGWFARHDIKEGDVIRTEKGPLADALLRTP